METNWRTQFQNSSSNILSQPSATAAAFTDRQLEKLVESNEGDGVGVAEIVRATNSSLTSLGHLQQPTSNFRPTGCLALSHAATGNHNSKNIVTSNSSLARITATPLRQPVRLMNGFAGDDGGQQVLTGCIADKHSQLRSSTTALDFKHQLQCRPSGIEGNGFSSNDSCIPLFTSNSSGATYAEVGKLLNAKSSSLTAFNVKSNPLDGVCCAETATTSARVAVNPADDDEQLKVKLVEQRYGNDSQKIHAAAIVIQRAFRKHQICKRFRTITEQLRHTCQSSSITALTSTPSQLSSDDRLKRDTIKHPTKSSPDGLVTFASGTTKAAAWESLSYAASRLAASAAAATANTKQALVGGVAKSASSQQVAVASLTVSHQQQQQPSNDRMSNSILSSTNANHIERPMKSDQVVAAAINFQQLESMRKRQYRVGLNIFNKAPEKGVSFLIAHSFIDYSPPYAKSSTSYYLSNQLHFIDKQLLAQQQSILTTQMNFQSCQWCYEEDNLKRNVAHFLLHRKGLAKEKIGQYLGNLQSQFNQDVLKHYLQELDFHGLQIDVALRKFSATLRLPGEAQKIERFVDVFASRYVQCQQQHQQNSANVSQAIQLTSHQRQFGTIQQDSKQNLSGKQSISNNQQQNLSANYKNNLTLLSKDEIFILTFAIIMLNTDLHSPSLKSTSRMSATQFVHNLRGVFKSQTINESDLIEIYERVKANQITTTPDHVTHVMKVQQGLTVTNFQRKELPNLCIPHRRLVCFCRLFEVCDINKKERVGQHQREIFLFNDLLLVTKLARRARASTAQQYAYRQSIPLQGLYVQLFQSTHYQFGIKLCQKSNAETLIMFNARNDLDRSRFVDDLSESIAEMDEMETIRAHNIIETIYFRHQERLRRHAAIHNSNENISKQNVEHVNDSSKQSNGSLSNNCDNRGSDDDRRLQAIKNKQDIDNSTAGLAAGRAHRIQSKFNSMFNLSSATNQEVVGGLRHNRSFAQQQKPMTGQQQPECSALGSDQLNGTQRSCSTGSVHSLDSGLFLSRDVSPNQSS